MRFQIPDHKKVGFSLVLSPFLGLLVLKEASWHVSCPLQRLMRQGTEVCS